MRNALLTQKILETVSQLPDDQAREVLDFATFVSQRIRLSDWHDLQNAQLTALTELWDNGEDEVWNEA